MQVALSFLLLFGAGLFVGSLHNLKSTDTGVALDNLVTFQLSPSLSGYDQERATLFYRSLLERLRSAPNVTSAAFVSVPILAGIPSAIWLGRLVSSQLHGIEPNTEVAVATLALLAIVSAAAGLIPAQRASRIDPILALRHE